MRKTLAASLVVGLVVMGCVPRLQRPDPESSRRALGDYAFRIENRNYDPIKGVMAIREDTVAVDGPTGTCWRQLGKPATDRMQTFRCGPPPGASSLYITVDANHPAISRWVASQEVVRMRRECVGWKNNKEGFAPYCVRWAWQTFVEDSSYGGRLVVEQLASYR